MTKPLAAFQGTTLYLDTVFLVRAADFQAPGSQSCREFLTRAIDPANPIALWTATLTIDETVFILLQEQIARPPYNVTRSRSQYLAAHPEVVRAMMPLVENELQPVLELVSLEPVLPADITAMCLEMRSSGTLPRDAIHLAVMRRLGIPAIASDDDDFDRYSDITLYKP